MAHGRDRGKPLRRSVSIYLEGGGDTSGTRAALRHGMDTFLQPLKQAARDKALRWKLVACGTRREAYKGFRNAIHDLERDEVVVLLVDAEGPVNRSASEHLRNRDGWDFSLASDYGVQPDDVVHLMVETMETWIVADPHTLGVYYGQGFRTNALPKAQNLETVTRIDVAHSLKEATRQTRKGSYHKIKHASDLLRRIDVEKVKRRCRHCRLLFERLGPLVDAA